MTSMHSVKPRKKVCEHKRSKKEGCPDCDKMKLEMVSIIYSITTQYEGIPCAAKRCVFLFPVPRSSCR